MHDEISLLDAVAQAELVRRGEVKPHELVEAAIARAERLEPRLHAIVTRLPESLPQWIHFSVDARFAIFCVAVTGGAALLFGLVPLASSIQDFNDNITRFIVIGRRPLNSDAPNKTTIVFSLPNEPGSLFKALSAFALRGVDMTKLESRPIPGRPWEYLFYADLAAARDELPCARALAHLAEFAPTLRTLGSYASWKTHEGWLPGSSEVV